MLNHNKYYSKKDAEVGVTEVKAVGKIPTNALQIFLAGSIEQGKAKKWHSALVDGIKEEFGDDEIYVVILNPRRDDWDSSWEQNIKNKQFYTQVDWEMTGIYTSDLIVFNFEDDTQSPITLLELGFVAGLMTEDPDLDVVVRCSEKFWRFGNVQYICDTFGIKHVETLEELVKHTIKIIKNN
jgi:hypothetical protein